MEQKKGRQNKNTNVWAGLTGILDAPFSQEIIDWSKLCDQVQKTVMIGLASNSPRPAGPKSPLYPPVLMMSNLRKWLREAEDLIYSPGFRDYVSTLMNMSGAMYQTNPIYTLEPIAEDFVALLCEILIPLAKDLADSKPVDASEALYAKYKKIRAEGGSDVAEDIKSFVAELAPPINAVVSSCAKARQLISQRPDLQVAVKAFNLKGNPPLQFVYYLCTLLDEEIIVVHQQERKGYRVHVSGICNNKLFGLLLSGVLIQSSAKEPELLQGTRPAGTLISVADGSGPDEVRGLTWSHPFTFSNWTCVSKENVDLPVKGVLAGASHWIWRDGCPYEILPFEGTRIVILGPVIVPHEFVPSRPFEELTASAKITRVMSKEEVDALLHRLAEVDELTRDQAVQQLATTWPH